MWLYATLVPFKPVVTLWLVVTTGSNGEAGQNDITASFQQMVSNHTTGGTGRNNTTALYHPMARKSHNIKYHGNVTRCILFRFRITET